MTLIKALWWLVLAAVLAAASCSDASPPPTTGTAPGLTAAAPTSAPRPAEGTLAGTDAARATAPTEPPGGSGDGISLEEAVRDSLVLTEYSVVVTGPGSVRARPGSGPVELPFVVTNAGEQPDTYAMTAFGADGYADLRNVPPTLELAPGERVTIDIPVSVPADADPGTSVIIRLNAASSASPPIQDEAEVEVFVEG